MKMPKSGKRTLRKPPSVKRRALVTPKWAKRDTEGRLVVNIAPAKAHLSAIVRLVERGETVLLARAGKPIARFQLPDRPRRVWGLSAGKVKVPDDFNETPPGFEDYA